MTAPFSNGAKNWKTNGVTDHLFFLFFFPFSFFLWIKQGLFPLFLLAFVFFSLIAHNSFSLFESELYRTVPAKLPYIDMIVEIESLQIGAVPGQTIVNRTFGKEKNFRSCCPPDCPKSALARMAATRTQ